MLGSHKTIVNPYVNLDAFVGAPVSYGKFSVNDGIGEALGEGLECSGGRFWSLRRHSGDQSTPSDSN
jgi:hypothetical protein